MTSEATTPTKEQPANDSPSNGGPASKAQLQALWTMLLDTCTHYLTTVPPEQQKTSMLEVCRSFLRDNGVTVEGRAPAQLKQDAEALKDVALPFTSTH